MSLESLDGAGGVMGDVAKAKKPEDIPTRVNYSYDKKRPTVDQQVNVKLIDPDTYKPTCMDKKYSEILGRPVRYQSIANICNESDRVGWQPSPR